jgi:hypothetical protein
MILGSSRAAQGIVPSRFETGRKFGLFNYSFTNYNSPFGPCYFEAAKKKFSGEKGGLFILEVNPFTLSNYLRNMEGDEEVFEECSTPPSNMIFVDHDPNFEYIVRNYSGDLRSLVGFKEQDVSHFLHDDGWLEIEMAFDTAYFHENTAKKIKVYEQLIGKMQPSKARWNALAQTVDYFSDYGRVILVRVPISAEMARIERTYYPEFENEIKAFAIERELPFLDYGFLNDSLFYTDGNHLHRNSAKAFTDRFGADLQALAGQSYSYPSSSLARSQYSSISSRVISLKVRPSLADSPSR